MKLYRIARAKYKRDLSGQGANLFGGRWNNKGTPALYTSTHVSLAVLEIIAQAGRTYIAAEQAWVLTLLLPDASSLRVVSAEELPLDWRRAPRDPATQALGDEWFAKGELGLLVPSAVLPIEHNVVLNPQALAFDQLQTVDCQPLEVDGRVAPQPT